MDRDEALKYYDEMIRAIIRHCPTNFGGIPGNWRADLHNELQYQIMYMQDQSNGQLNDDIVFKRFMDVARQFDKLERSYGATDCPNKVYICPRCTLEKTTSFTLKSGKKSAHSRKCLNCLHVWRVSKHSKVYDFVVDPFPYELLKKRAAAMGYRMIQSGDKVVIDNKLA